MDDEQEQESYNKNLYSYLADNHKVFLHEEELEHLVDVVRKRDMEEDNKGFMHRRIKTNEMEKAFYETWQKHNMPSPGINFGFGTLQDLFCEREHGIMSRTKVHLFINSRDRYVVATVIQWLGTNVGMGFLHEVLRKFGARIQFKK